MSSQNQPLSHPQGLDPGGQACCETGRPVMTDPVTGQTVCSCQYEAQLLNYQRLASAGLPMYGTAAPYTADPGVIPLGADPAAFFAPATNGFDLKDNLEAWRTLPYASLYYPYDSATLAGYPFAAGYGMDINGARRKNATRETTSTLKAWLNEHRKNPYPTKGEKIMLAIITKMTLTQVSTWFANARRRLKKENKMTWEPRNRCDDEDADLDGDDDEDVTSSGKKNGSKGDEDEDDKKPMREGNDGVRDRQQLEDGDESDGDRESLDDGSGGIYRRSLQTSSPSSDTLHLPILRSPGANSLSTASEIESSLTSDLCIRVKENHPHSPQSCEPAVKPRIWSIVDMATSKSPRGHDPETNNRASPTASIITSPSLLSSQKGLSTSPRTPHLSSTILPPFVRGNWYATPMATSHLPSHHPPPPPPSFSLTPSHPAFQGVMTSGSSCHPAVAVLNDSAAVASSLTRLRTAAAAATAAGLAAFPGTHLVSSPTPPSTVTTISRSSTIVSSTPRSPPPAHGNVTESSPVKTIVNDGGGSPSPNVSGASASLKVS